MANNTNSVLDLIKWARGNQQAETCLLEPAPPTLKHARLPVASGATHTFAVSQFPVSVAGGKSLVHLRIRVIGKPGRLQLRGADVEPGTQVTVSDLYAGNLTFVSTGDDIGWFDYEAYDGQLYSECARMTLGTAPQQEMPGLPSLRTETAESVVEDLASLMVAPAAAVEPMAPEETTGSALDVEVANRPTPIAEPPQSRRPVATSPRVEPERRARPRSTPGNDRASKLARASAHRMRQWSKTQSRRSSMRKRRGPAPD